MSYVERNYYSDGIHPNANRLYIETIGGLLVD